MTLARPWIALALSAFACLGGLASAPGGDGEVGAPLPTSAGDAPASAPPEVRNLTAALGGAAWGDVVLSWDPPGSLAGVLHFSIYVSENYMQSGVGYTFLA